VMPSAVQRRGACGNSVVQLAFEEGCSRLGGSSGLRAFQLHDCEQDMSRALSAAMLRGCLAV
jgi:hypothetical protein